MKQQDQSTLEGSVLAALPAASRHIKFHGQASLTGLLRHEHIPYGIGRRAMECLCIMGVAKAVNGSQWVRS